MATGILNAFFPAKACVPANTVYINSITMLWLVLHCPGLALEVFAGLSVAAPTAVVDRDGAREPVVACSEAARGAGIGSGLPLGAARARVASLQVLVRDPEAERIALQRLGSACLAWSDHVALEPPTDLLLEIGGSLRLFGGVDPILAEVDERLAGLGHTVVQGVAPTPTAARVLARTGGGVIREPDSLESRLAPLPWTALEPDAATAKRLARWGLATLGDCFALPRAGLAQRLGTAFVDRLDRLRGLCGESVPRFTPPARFHGRLALPEETTGLELPLAALERLTAEFEAWLRARDAGVERFEIDLHPLRGSRTSVCVGLSRAGREAEHLLGVAREKLERTTLPGPVVAVGLRGHRPVAYCPQGNGLWETAGQEPLDHVLDRMRARLGQDAVWRLKEHADPRPIRCVPETASAASPAQFRPRPIRLLPRPRALSLDGHGRPCCDGPLELLDGPERVETGWWEDDIERDYFIARKPNGATLWIYRERRVPRMWYLHGIFA